MSLPPNIRVNFGDPFPATVKGGGLIAIQKTNGIWTVSVNFALLLPGVNAVVDPAHSYVLVYNSLTGAASLVLATAFVAVPVLPARTPAHNAVVNIVNSDVEVGIDATGGSVTCPLPSVAAWTLANPNGLELTIFDYKGQATLANTITPTLNGGDTWVQGVGPVIKSAYGLIKLRPIASSWFVRGVS